jgi:2-iminobutanoate/2-iminopropanoate deaminase
MPGRDENAAMTNTSVDGKEKIQTGKAPAAIGPYSQANKAGGWIFTSGQIALDPFTGQIISGGIEEQTERVIQNLKAVLEAAGSSLAQVVKTTVYLKDMDEFVAMNGVYGKHFAAEGAVAPARSTVEVARLPKDVKVEIDVVALAG